MRTRSLNALFAVLVVVGAWLVNTHPKIAVVAAVGIAVLGVVALVLDGWQRLWAILIVLLFFSTSNQPDLVNDAYYTRYVASVLLAAFTWVGTRTADRSTLREAGKAATYLVTGLWLCAGVALMSTAWSVDSKTTALQALALLSLAWLVHGLITRRWRDRETMTADLGVAGVLFALLFTAGIIADAAGILPAFTSGAAANGRLRGYFDNYQALGIAAALVFLLLFGVWRETKKYVYLIALLPCAWSVLQSESRTGQVAVAAGLLWVLIRDRARFVRFVQAALVVGVGAAMTSAGIINGKSLISPFTRFTTEQGGDLFNQRNVAWGEAFHQWANRPVEGFGYSAGPTLFRALRDQGASRFGADVAHESYLQWFLETGLLGLIPLALALAACLMVVFRGRLGGLNTGLVAAVFAGLMIQFTESAMFGTGSNYPFLFWPVVAAAAVMYDRPKDDVPPVQIAAVPITATSPRI